MRNTLMAAIAAAAFVFVASGAQAMPASPLQGLTQSGPTITQVRDRCGRGYHRNWRGRCVRNRWWRR